MKKLLFVTVVALSFSFSAVAQSASLSFTTSKNGASLDFPLQKTGPNFLVDTPLEFTEKSPAFSLPTQPSLLGALPPGEPSASPEPRFVFGGRDDYRWQLGVGYEFVRFQSSAFNANLSGLHASLSYFTNDWFAWEGSVVAAFGGTIFANDRTKYLLYTGGPKIAWRRAKWEPWAHALVGGLHMLPQIAAQGKNGFALQIGGGADYRFNPTSAIRIESDYVHSQLYSSSQNFFQIGAGFVVHF
jgi:hypothetical protein